MVLGCPDRASPLGGSSRLSRSTCHTPLCVGPTVSVCSFGGWRTIIDRVLPHDAGLPAPLPSSSLVLPPLLSLLSLFLTEHPSRGFCRSRRPFQHNGPDQRPARRCRPPRGGARPCAELHVQRGCCLRYRDPYDRCPRQHRRSRRW